MAHDRDHDHPAPATPRAKPVPLVSKPKPDHKLREHPNGLPKEPVDPRAHPGRW